MRGARGHLRTVAVAVVAVAVALPGSAQAAGSRVTLAGTTVVHGSRTTFTRVRLPRPVKIGNPMLRPEYANTITTSGDDRFVGIALLADTPGFRGAGIVAGTLPAAARSARPVAHPTGGLDVTKSEWTLPAGNYRLYLIAHGRPVTVRLRFRGLTGAATLRPVGKVTATLATPPPSVTSGPAGLVYSAGANIDMPAPALYLSLTYLRHDQPHVVSYSEWCEYGRPPASVPPPYLPGCPSVTSERGTVGMVFDYQSIDPTLKMSVISGVAADEWRGGSGASWVTTTPATSAGYFHYWLAL